MNIVELFQQGGVILVFIGFQVWLVKFLLSYIREKDQIILTMMEKFDGTVKTSMDAVVAELSRHTVILERVCNEIRIDSDTGDFIIPHRKNS